MVAEAHGLPREESIRKQAHSLNNLFGPRSVDVEDRRFLERIRIEIESELPQGRLRRRCEWESGKSDRLSQRRDRELRFLLRELEVRERIRLRRRSPIRRVTGHQPQ